MIGLSSYCWRILDPSDLKNDGKEILPKLHGALLKNEQDVQLFEQLLSYLEITISMFLNFFLKLKESKIPVSLNEFFTFLKSTRV